MLVTLEDACEKSLLLSDNQSEQPCQSEFSGHTILTLCSMKNMFVME